MKAEKKVQTLAKIIFFKSLKNFFNRNVMN